jgi:hypothetical protein
MSYTSLHSVFLANSKVVLVTSKLFFKILQMVWGWEGLVNPKVRGVGLLW